ncbi:hypothetical protein AN1V17_32540 [Vallitalea sediminicola]
MNILQVMDIKTLVLADDYIEARIDITDFYNQSYGIVHGGLTITFAETLAGLGSKNILDEDYIAVGQNITANHLRPKRIGGYLQGTGRLIHRGKRTHLWTIEVKDERNKLISVINVTNAIMKIDNIKIEKGDNS